MAAADPRSPALSVIIPARDAERTLADQLEALVRQEDPPVFEVLVADNGSRDRTRQVAESFGDRLDLRVLEAGGVPGASHARNVGARAAGGTLLAFLDADDVASPQWTRAIHDAALAHPGAVVIGARDYELLNPPELVEGYGYRREVVTGSQPPAARRVDAVTSPVPGGNVLVPAATWHALGGMDETLPYGSEDTDLGIRAQLAGVEVWRDAAALVHYRFRTGVGAILRQQRTWARSRAQLALLHDDARLQPAGVRPDLVLLVRVVAGELRALRTPAGRFRMAHDVGNAVDKLQGSWAVRRSGRIRGRSAR